MNRAGTSDGSGQGLGRHSKGPVEYSPGTRGTMYRPPRTPGGTDPTGRMRSLGKEFSRLTAKYARTRA